jgi:hypothetical protein
MKEFKNMPVKVQEGNDGFEVYEYEEGFAMTTEFLGTRLGYADPAMSMARLFRRHKEALEQHRFIIINDNKPKGGRPTNFFDLRGCERAAAFAKTEQANELYIRISDLRAKLEAKRIERIEKSWFSRRPWWPEVRDRVMKGENFQQIAVAMNRSSASIRNAVRRMIEFGIMMPLRAAQALAGRARRTVIDYGRRYYGDSSQQALPFNAVPV